jgi:two-component system OmpR family sensor kinase
MHSLRARLTAWYSLVLALVLTAFGTATYALLKREISRNTDTSLTSTAHELASTLSNEASESAESFREADAAGVLLDFRYSREPIVVFGSHGEEVAASHTAQPVDRAALGRFIADKKWGLHTLYGKARFRMILMPIQILGRPHVLAVMHSLEDESKTLAGMRRSMLLAIPLALLIAAGGGYLLARKSLAPVAAMSEKARQIGAANLAERIAVSSKDELGQLAGTLNELLQRLEESFESQRRFMADASHELRTPVAILQGEIDVSLSRKDRNADDYRQSLEIMRRSVRKLTRIVHDLFLLARTDAGQYPIDRQRFYLDETLASTVQSFRTLAAESRITLREEHPADMLMTGDEHLLQRLVANLVENAIKYTPPGGEVVVRAASHNSTVRVEVSDSGPGIPPDLRERIFLRFFRIDDARPTGGAGLGLPIARWIAEAHSGRIWIEERERRGSTFVVELPA